MPVLLSLFFCSCAKSPLIINTTPTSIAALNFTQASPDEPPVYLYLSNYTFGTSVYNYGQYSGYGSVNAGVNTVSVNNAANSNVILSDSINFKASAI